MALVLVILAAVTTAVVQSMKVVAALPVITQDVLDAFSRLALQATDLTKPVPGVTVTIDPIMPPQSACQLYKLTTKTKGGRTLEVRASKGCLVQ